MSNNTTQDFIDEVKGCLAPNSSGSGANGKSAYEVAVANGFEGTEKEWLESLKGKYASIDTELSTTSENPVQNKAIATAITNPNLLINPDFKINQRRQMEYNILHSGYSIDGWKCNVGCTVTPHSGGVRVTSNGAAYSGIWQQLENRWFYADEAYTPSVFFNERPPSDWYLDVHLVNKEGDTVIAASSNQNVANMTVGIVTLPPLVVPSDGEYYLRMFICTKSTTVSTIDIRYAKLEKGSIATPFVTPDPATELAKCQRYFYAIPFGTERFIGTGGANGIGHITLPLPTTMRITPTISNSDGSETKLFIANGSTMISNVTITQVYYGQNDISVMINGTGITNGQVLCGYHQRTDDGSDLPMYISAEL